MAESPSAIPTLPGLAVESVEWLPSGAEAGLVRVRGRWIDESARQAELPVLALRAAGAEHRFDSLPDARFSRDPSSWRGTYLVPAELVAGEPEALWLEWEGGARSGLPALARGLEPPPVAAVEPAEEPEDVGGQVIDRAVMAERRARRAEAAERRQARVAEEALKAVEVLELRSAELERRLEEATSERDALAARESDLDERRGALSAALASAAALRSRSREWQLHMRTSEVARAGDAVRLAVLEAERATTAPALRAALDEAKEAAVAARAALSESDGQFAEGREAWDRRRAELEAELVQVREELDRARALESALTAAEGRAEQTESRLRVETVARTTLEDELDRERAARADLRRALDEARADAADAADLRAELTTARTHAATAEGLRAELAAARAEAVAARDEAAAARDDAVAARDEVTAARAEAATARSEAATARSEADAARDEIAAARTEVVAARDETAAARTAADAARDEVAAARSEAVTARDETAAARDQRAAAQTVVDGLRAELAAARAETAAARDEVAAIQTVADGLRAELATARDEVAALGLLRGELETARGALDDLRTDLESERAARRAAEALQAKVVELEQRAQSGRDELERLAREQAEAAAVREPATDPARLVADLDAAAEALRRRPPAEPVAPDADAAVESASWPDAAAPVEAASEPVEDRPRAVVTETWAPAAPAAEPAAPDAEPAVEWSRPSDEPAAPDAEPAVEWSEAVDFAPGEVVHATEPRRSGEPGPDVEWGPSRFDGAAVDVEPPAPDAEPYVESAPPQAPPAIDAPPQAETTAPDEVAPPSAEATATVEAAPPAESAPPAEAALPAESAPAAEPASAVVAAPAVTTPVPDVAPAPARPKVIPASKPPARGLMLGTDRREYPLLRGAIVKLAHDDPALAGRLLAALLPAQGIAIQGPFGYDLTIPGVGTYGISIGIAAGRASVRPLEAPRGRPDAEFHLTAEPLILAELLAGVEHRIGRFFGPARVRGRKRRVKALAPLKTTTATFADVARAGAALDPELVYRAFAYAVHPSWTRGHTFTVAQEIEGDPPETWYLTARDGAGLTVSATPPDPPPVATVSMSRDVFAELLREEAVPPGRRPCVRGDQSAVALMHAWTRRARANA